MQAARAQVWMRAHHPERGSVALGTRPLLHAGFHKAWTASGLHAEVISFLQVSHMLALYKLKAL